MPALLDAPTRAPRVADLSPDALAARFGGIDPARILTDPPPGTATEDDFDRVRRETGRLFELIDGTFVEKAVSSYASTVAFELIKLLGRFLDDHPSKGYPPGIGMGPDGFVRLTRGAFTTTRLRAPDVSYVSRGRFPRGGFPRTGYPTLAPDLVVEVLSPGNTRAETAEKRANFFAAGTVRVWVIDPLAETAEVYDDPDTPVPIPAGGTLDAGDAPPGFTVDLAALLRAVRWTTGWRDGEE